MANRGNVSRRDALKLGGLTFAGLAGASLFGCSSGAASSSPAASAAASAAASSASASAAAREGQIIARDAFIGLDELVQLADGSKVAAINFDNGATTPALASALEAIQEQLPMYGSIGRGKGQKQSHSTEVFNAAREDARLRGRSCKRVHRRMVRHGHRRAEQNRRCARDR